MMNTIYVSKEGLEFLNVRLKKAKEQLVAVRAEKNTAYTATGDTWHDNPYFNSLEQDEKRKVGEVGELIELIKNAKVFSFEKRNVLRVQLGSILHIYRYYKISGEEEEFVWEVGGYGETDISKQRVAYNAPAMEVLMGKCVGDTLEADSPKGPVEYEVLGLFPTWEEVPCNFRIS